MSLEEQRKANLARNAAKMREFRLEKLNASTFGPSETPKPAKSAKSSKPKPKRSTEEPVQPLRKSRRLQGVKVESSEEINMFDQPAPPVKHEPEISRREGELKLKQLVGEGDWDQAMQVLNQLGNSFGGNYSNMSDLYDTIEPTDKEVKELRREFDSLHLDERDINITQDRIFSMILHPSSEKRLVVAGDKVGQIGLWDADKPDYEGQIQLNYHNAAIPRLDFDVSKPENLYSCSYDGSVRVLNLVNQKSTELFALGDPTDPEGISDFHLVENSIYYTTLQGSFGIIDTRSDAKKNASPRNQCVLSEKKIGGFSVDPLNPNQIATGSLDRTMKLWDIRNAEEPLGVYDSRLSVSSTSWNNANQIVCNGYDDTINVFNAENIVEELSPSVRLKHNCQTGRWVSILKSHWQGNPKDGVQKFVIGNMKKFVDIFTGTGQQIAHLEGARTVPAVVALHRGQNWVVGGTASGKAYLWTNNVKEEQDGTVKEES